MSGPASYPHQYSEGIIHFNSRRYYEAHEIWEEIWLKSTGTEKLFYQMLIQSAVGLHHYERGNAVGARGMYRRVIDKLDALPAVFMSLDLAEYSVRFREFFHDLIHTGIEGAPEASKPRPKIGLRNR
jgi:predicted metal-dependent hydrolase